MRRTALTAILIMIAQTSFAAAGDVANGEVIYAKRCVGCHGVDGDGLGPGADRLVPPPRDFSSGMYKIMSTAFDGYIPQDQDIYDMISQGMPGTAMPGWQDVLSDQDMWDVVAYIKTFSGYDEEQAGPVVDYGDPVENSADSISKGKALFEDGDRCTECHGSEGKGNAIKRLLGDNGERTWPRNLTKPWTFRHSNDPRNIFTRVSVGIPGTQMPSFADPDSKLVLSAEERWHVANYVASMAKVEEVVNPNNTVVKSQRMADAISDDPYDEIWATTSPSTFILVPQILAAERQFTPSNDTITVRSLNTPDEMAILLEWDDRTQSLPGDEDAEKIADEEIYEDMVAIQLPTVLPSGMEKPYFGFGDKKNPVNLWQWRSGTSTEAQSVSTFTATGFNTSVATADTGVTANGEFRNGTWRVVFKQKITAEEGFFVEGVFIPVAFSVWDGSNSETGTKHTLTTWYWLLLESGSTTLPFIGALFALFLVIALQFVWVRNSSRNRTV